MSDGPAGDRRADQRGDAPLIGIVILFGMVFVGASVVLLAGVTLLEDVQVDAGDERALQEFQTLDSKLETGSLGSDTVSFDLNRDEGGYEVNRSANLSITVTNRFGDTCGLEGGEMDLGTLRYENARGEVVASQAGGVFRRTDDGTRVVAEPGVRYYTDGRNGIDVHRLEVDVTTFDGTIGSGQTDAALTPRVSDQSDCFEEIRHPTGVEVVVTDSPYHDGWARFLREEFGSDGEVDHDRAANRVVAEAPLGHTRPFADYVDFEPTIYGGLYVNATGAPGSAKFDGPLTIDGYDSRNGTYGSGDVNADLLVVDTDRLDLLPGADISGHPVVSGDLKARSGASVSPFVYRHGADRNPAAVDEVRSIRVSEAFEPIEPIDGTIRDAHRYLADQPTVLGNETTPGEYAVDGNLAHSGTTFDVSGGDTHVAVDGDVSLTDVRVTGGGQVHIYAGGDEIDLENVTVEGDRADALWIYGGSETNAAVSDRFQGVVYAPGRGDLEIDDHAEIYGAVVGGRPGPGAGNDVGDDVDVHFDTALRSAVPVPQEAETVEREIREPIDVSFVLDRSGSMGSCRFICIGSDPREKRLDATRGFIDELDESAGDRVSAYEFDDSAHELHELSGDFESVRGELEANARGNTNMAAGMRESLDDFERDGGSGGRAMVLLSDGENSDEWYQDPRTRAQAQRAADMDVKIYTVGLGDDHNEELLTDVADETGGEYVDVDEADELETSFEDIAVDVIEAANTEFETITYDGVDTPDEYVIKVSESEVDVGE